MKMPIRILLVEDNEDDLFLSQRTLAKAGITSVFHVSNGREAMNYLAGRADFADRSRYPFPDLVLLDLKMPGCSGHEVLEWIREQPELHSLRVFVLTSSDEACDRNRVTDAGAAGYFVKPLNGVHLKAIYKQEARAVGRPVPGGDGNSDS